VRLGTRLALSFSVAIVLTVLMSFAIGAQVWRLREADYDGSQDAQQALLRWQQGPQELEHWLREQRRADGIFRMLLTENGEPLADRDLPPPPRLREALAALAAGNHNVQLPGGGRLHSTIVVTNDGQRLRWIAVIPPPRGPEVRRLDTLLLLSIGILLVSALAWYLARRITQPISDLQDTSRAVAAGRLDARVSAQTLARGDELGALALDFNHMAERLQKLIESQRQLLRDISHELRSPLARLQIATELARGSRDERQLDRIEQETARLDELIGQLLLIARLEHTGPAVGQERIALDDLIDAICQDARFEAQARDVDVRGELQTGVHVHGQSNLLHSAIENVIRNAVRHTASHSCVQVRLYTHGERCLIDVDDQGPGIPDDQLAAVFEPFVRVSVARERESGGYGLGLAITRRVIESLHGSVHAENRREGGLRVSIDLPSG